MKKLAAALGAAAAGVGTVAGIASWRWRSGSAALVSRLRRAAEAESAPAPRAVRQAVTVATMTVPTASTPGWLRMRRASETGRAPSPSDSSVAGPVSVVGAAWRSSWWRSGATESWTRSRAVRR